MHKILLLYMKYYWFCSESLHEQYYKLLINIFFDFIYMNITHDNIFGSFLVGTDVISCPQTRVPTPKNTHQSH